MPISAECHSDDRIVEAEFDAEPWFAQASDVDICKLAACGWGGDYPADETAIFMADINEDVKRVFTYLELVAHKKNHPGFECHVDPQSASAWVLKHRQHLIPTIQRTD